MAARVGLPGLPANAPRNDKKPVLKRKRGPLDDYFSGHRVDLAAATATPQAAAAPRNGSKAAAGGLKLEPRTQDLAAGKAAAGGLKLEPRTQDHVALIRRALLALVKKVSTGENGARGWFPIYPHCGANGPGGAVPLGELAQLFEACYATMSGPQLQRFAVVNKHLFTREIMDAIMERGYWPMQAPLRTQPAPPLRAPRATPHLHKPHSTRSPPHCRPRSC